MRRKGKRAALPPKHAANIAGHITDKKAPLGLTLCDPRDTIFSMTEQYPIYGDVKPQLHRQGIAFYYQMAGHFRTMISQNIWKPLERLPSMDELAAQYGVARVTIRQAIKLLEAEGILETHQGRGTFVRARPKVNPWLALQGNWLNLMENLSDHGVEILKSEQSLECLTLEGYDASFAPMYRYQLRKHSRSAQIFGLNHMYIDARIYDKAPALMDSKPVLLELKKFAPHPVKIARQALTIVQADVEVAHLLEVPLGMPLAKVCRIVIDSTDTIIYSCEIVYRGDTIKLDINLEF